MEIATQGCRGCLLRVWPEHKHGQDEFCVGEVCDIRRLRGRMRLGGGEQVSQNES